MLNEYVTPPSGVTKDSLTFWDLHRLLRMSSIFIIILAILLTGTFQGFAEDFTLIVLPDTQYYSENHPEIFQAQTQWIVDNKDTLNIVYVAHEGDIVEHADDENEWINADNAMSRLDAAMIPYGVVPGNHDEPEPTTFYNQYFGVDRFCNAYPTDCISYYGDGYPFGSNDNNYTLFTAGGMDFIVINLDAFYPAGGVLYWADQLLKDNNDRRAIVVSHYILNSDATFGSWGQQIYDALSDNPNLFLMLCGHIHAEARRTDGKLHTLLSNYQDYSYGGSGFLRVLHFSPEKNEIRVETYSPWLDQYETDPNSQFTLSWDFIDVPPGYWAEQFIYKIYNAGITTGCSQNPLKYCPENMVTRTQMAVFLGKAIHGSSFTPPSATGIFSDVPVSYWAADWIEQFYHDSITTGCGTNPLKYCPYNPVTRAQMAIFLLKSKHGKNYTPPAATGIFSDVPVTYWAASWIEQLYYEGITTGCSTGPLKYCPENSVTRAQMAVFIVRTFGL